MYIMKFISIPIVIISFAIGVFCVYHTAPASKVILIYPTPENVSDVQYKDKTNTCFSFTNNFVECPEKQSSITNIPIQN